MRCGWNEVQSYGFFIFVFLFGGVLRCRKRKKRFLKSDELLALLGFKSAWYVCFCFLMDLSWVFVTVYDGYRSNFDIRFGLKTKVSIIEFVKAVALKRANSLTSTTHLIHLLI
jgi:hypothetical protein